jgi:hypothetical protein
MQEEKGESEADMVEGDADGWGRESMEGSSGSVGGYWNDVVFS